MKKFSNNNNSFIGKIRYWILLCLFSLLIGMLLRIAVVIFVPPYKVGTCLDTAYTPFLEVKVVDNSFLRRSSTLAIVTIFGGQEVKLPFLELRKLNVPTVKCLE